MIYFTEEQKNILHHANAQLKIKDDLSIEKNRTIFFIYSPPKVGSTSLVSSLRLSQANKVTVVHVHNEIMLKILCNIENVTINDIIKYNKWLGKTVYVIDIYRTPIERKMSLFFQDVSVFHFNTSVENLSKYKIERIISRFNNIFLHIGNEDYYREVYDISYSDCFPFSEKYAVTEKNEIKYIKLRLNDSHEWRFMLKQITGLDVMIVKDYETEKKGIGSIYKKFKEVYKIPPYLLEKVKSDNSLNYYLTQTEVSSYIDRWSQNSGCSCSSSCRCVGYSQNDYNLYMKISGENACMLYIEKVTDHYLDVGCVCVGCSRKRDLVVDSGVISRVMHEDRRLFLIKKEKKRVINMRLAK